MTDINMANRQCCNVDIRDYVTKKPFLDADFCNTTTTGFSGDAVWATKKGAKCIAFDNPLDGTMALEFQVHPFKAYALLSDGEVETSAIIARHERLFLKDGMADLTYIPVPGSVSVFAEGKYIDNITVENENLIVNDSIDFGLGVSDGIVDVYYTENRTSGVQKISFNNKRVPKYYFVQMSTLDKDENGDLIPVLITAYKATPERNLELSFSSTGEPAEITITMSCLEDADGNVIDMVEILPDENEE